MKFEKGFSDRPKERITTEPRGKSTLFQGIARRILATQLNLAIIIATFWPYCVPKFRG
jgi:hypothetical protein